MSSSKDLKLTIRISTADKSLIDRAVRIKHMTLQDWAETALLDAAGKHMIDPFADSAILRTILSCSLFSKVITENALGARLPANFVATAEAKIATRVAEMTNQLNATVPRTKEAR